MSIRIIAATQDFPVLPKKLKSKKSGSSCARALACEFIYEYCFPEKRRFSTKYGFTSESTPSA